MSCNGDCSSCSSKGSCSEIKKKINPNIKHIPPLTPPQGEPIQKSKFDFEKIFESYGAEWVELFKQWLEYKREKKNMYKGEKSMRAMAKKLFEMAGGDIKTARLIVEQSIANNWAGLFVLSSEKRKPNNAEDIRPQVRYDDWKR